MVTFRFKKLLQQLLRQKIISSKFGVRRWLKLPVDSLRNALSFSFTTLGLYSMQHYRMFDSRVVNYKCKIGHRGLKFFF